MNLKKTLVTVCMFAMIVVLAGCQRACTGCERSMQFTERNYTVYQYSGDSCVNVYKFRGILNNQEQSDGFYWYKNDTLFEVSGTLRIESTK